MPQKTTGSARPQRFRLAGMLCVLLASLACGRGGGGALSSAAPTQASTPSVPKVSLEQPGEQSTVPPGKLTVTARVEGFRLVDKVGSPAVPGEGHLLFYLGVDFIPSKPGERAHTAPGTYQATADPSYTWIGIEEGKQSLGVQLVNNDDTPLDPPVTKSVLVTVSASASPAAPLASDSDGAPTSGNNRSGDARIEIASPADGSTVSDGDLEVVTEVQGVELVDKIGRRSQQGEGHIIYYLGTDYTVPTDPGRSADAGGRGTFTSAASAKASYVWPENQIEAGEQTFTVQLVGNDGTPLDPPRVARITVTVKG